MVGPGILKRVLEEKSFNRARMYTVLGQSVATKNYFPQTEAEGLAWLNSLMWGILIPEAILKNVEG